MCRCPPSHRAKTRRPRHAVRSMGLESLYHRLMDGHLTRWRSCCPTPTQATCPLPVDLSDVHFVQDANLNDTQLALLAQNGFVVVPKALTDLTTCTATSKAWNHTEGKADFVQQMRCCTLFLAYQNALMFLKWHVYGDVANFSCRATAAAGAAREAVGTRVEVSARTPRCIT